MFRARPPWIVLIALAGASCWRQPPSAAAFDVVRTSPELGPASGTLRLNDTITVYFSAPLNPVSVTSDTVAVLDERGHQVPGKLRVGPNWVTFEPMPPLSADLLDGSFQPGCGYRLQIAGYPRPDALRAADGRRLDRAHAYELRTTPRAVGEVSPTSLLRPLDPDLPFLQRRHETPQLQLLPSDSPRLQLHFTLPVLPTTVGPEAFRIHLGHPIEEIVPRSVRLLSSSLDDFPGCTVEIDLGSSPRLRGGGSGRALRAGDFVSVSVQNVAAPLRDYAGNPVLAAEDQCWSVVRGTSITLLQWPAEDGSVAADDPLAPGFEAVAGALRPRVRLEAGDGSLGVFRPRSDLVLRPGVPFDRGDGVHVTSRGDVFPFLSIDIPAGITVRVDARHGGVRLLSCGGIHIGGTLLLDSGTVPLVVPQPGLAVPTLLDAAPVSLLAAGDIFVRGRAQVVAPLPADHTALTVACAGRIVFHPLGELPYNTILAVESSLAAPAEPAIEGPRGQVVATVATFTYGIADGGRWTARGGSQWRSLPLDRDGGVLRVVDADTGLRVAWQVAPADPVRRGEPDLGAGRIGRQETAGDQQRIVVPSGSFVRFLVEADLAAGQALPSLREVRLVAP
jgi:hypothetical protein